MSALNNDITIINKILKGQSDAFSALYRKYARFYLVTALRYVKDRAEAEDMLQEACIKIYKDLYQFDENKASFINWSKKIVINTCLMHLRKKSVFDVMDNIFEIGTTISVDANALEKLKLEDLTKLIQTLPKGYRTVFNMYIIDGYSHNEIAESLDISVNTSKTQLMKARKYLQLKIAERDNSFMESYA